MLRERINNLCLRTSDLIKGANGVIAIGPKLVVSELVPAAEVPDVQGFLDNLASVVEEARTAIDMIPSFGAVEFEGQQIVGPEYTLRRLNEHFGLMEKLKQEAQQATGRADELAWQLRREKERGDVLQRDLTRVRGYLDRVLDEEARPRRTGPELEIDRMTAGSNGHYDIPQALLRG